MKVKQEGLVHFLRKLVRYDFTNINIHTYLVPLNFKGYREEALSDNALFPCQSQIGHEK